MNFWILSTLVSLSLSFFPAVMPGAAAGAVCANGSVTDCNPEGATLIATSAFVDQAPPAGFVQCAGFVNSNLDDVRWDWEQNCLALKAQYEFDHPERDLEFHIRIFHDETGELLAGSRLHSPAVLDLAFLFPNALNYQTADLEGEGFLDVLPLSPGNIAGGGVTLFWDESDPVPDNSVLNRRCSVTSQSDYTDLIAANSADTMLLHVGATAADPAQEAVYGPGSKTNVCNFTGALTTALRVAIYAKSAVGPPTPPDPISLIVPIDIKPGDDENRINPDSKGVVIVAILSDALFIAPEEVDAAMLHFGPGGEEASPRRCEAADANGDAYPDLVCFFRTQEAGFQPGDIEGVMTGATIDGLPFTGTDHVKIKARRHRRRLLGARRRNHHGHYR